MGVRTPNMGVKSALAPFVRQAGICGSADSSIVPQPGLMSGQRLRDSVINAQPAAVLAQVPAVRLGSPRRADPVVLQRRAWHAVHPQPQAGPPRQPETVSTVTLIWS